MQSLSSFPQFRPSFPLSLSSAPSSFIMRARDCLLHVLLKEKDHHKEYQAQEDENAFDWAIALLNLLR